MSKNNNHRIVPTIGHTKQKISKIRRCGITSHKVYSKNIQQILNKNKETQITNNRIIYSNIVVANLKNKILENI